MNASNPPIGRDLQFSRGGLVPSSVAVMQLGRIEQLPPAETSDLAKQVFELVERARQFAGQERALRAPLTFAGYKAALHKLDSIRRALHSGGFVPNDSPELRRFVVRIYDEERHSADVAGFMNYLGAVNGALGQAVLQIMQRSAGAQFSESQMRMHAHVVGGSGSGKSELLKLMIHHHVKHPELGAVLVLDPHRKMAREVARWREFAANSDRLMYLDARVEDVDDPGVPALNPLGVCVDDEDAKAEIAKQLADAVGVLRENDVMTGNMVSVATFCFRALLEKPGATLVDLRTLLSANEDHPLVQTALQMEDPYHRQFFEPGGSFFGDSYKPAKQALMKRLDDTLFAPRLRRVLSAPSPIDLEAAVEARKVICVDVGSVGPHADNTYGRLVMALVVALGQRRIADRRAPQTPLRVFVDEATKLMSPSVFTILKELRKVGISLVMGQQQLGDGVDRGLVSTLKTNTNVKLFGRNATMSEIFKMMSWDGDVPKLRNGQFIAAWGDEDRVILDTYTAPYLADDTNAMSEAQWQAVLEQQLRQYYRRTAPLPSPQTLMPVPPAPASPINPMDEYPA